MAEGEPRIPLLSSKVQPSSLKSTIPYFARAVRNQYLFQYLKGGEARDCNLDSSAICTTISVGFLTPLLTSTTLGVFFVASLVAELGEGLVGAVLVDLVAASNIEVSLLESTKDSAFNIALDIEFDFSTLTRVRAATLDIMIC